jgi:hypothetical protein
MNGGTDSGGHTPVIIDPADASDKQPANQERHSKTRVYLAEAPEDSRSNEHCGCDGYATAAWRRGRM